MDINKLNLKNEDDVLKIMLTISGYRKVEDLSDKILKKYGSLINLLASDNVLVKYDDKLNDRFILLLGLMNGYSKENVLKEGEVLPSTYRVIEFLKKEIGYMQNETFNVLFLSNKFELISFERISKGTIDKSYVFLRQLLEKSLYLNAKNLIITHNHPSGSLTPSSSDVSITLKIKEGLEIFEIGLVDHIIVSKEGYYSFAEGGII